MKRIGRFNRRKYCGFLQVFFANFYCLVERVSSIFLMILSKDAVPVQSGEPYYIKQIYIYMNTYNQRAIKRRVEVWQIYKEIFNPGIGHINYLLIKIFDRFEIQFYFIVSLKRVVLVYQRRTKLNCCEMDMIILR